MLRFTQALAGFSSAGFLLLPNQEEGPCLCCVNRSRHDHSVRRASVANFIEFFGTIQARIRRWEKNLWHAVICVDHQELLEILRRPEQLLFQV